MGRCLRRNGDRAAMLSRFSRQRNYDRTRDFMPPGGTVFSLLLRPLAWLYVAICVWITAKVLRAKLKRAYVEILGRFEEWSPQDMRGNPVTGAVVDLHLAFATHEQLRAGVIPKQATPILRPDFQHLIRYMHTRLLCAAQPVDRLAYARDMALFAVAFRAGSRGSDLAKLLAAQVKG